MGMKEEMLKARMLDKLEELGNNKNEIPVENRAGYVAALFDMLVIITKL